MASRTTISKASPEWIFSIVSLLSDAVNAAGSAHVILRDQRHRARLGPRNTLLKTRIGKKNSVPRQNAMSPIFRRGADSVNPVQIDVHGHAPAGHNHLLKSAGQRVRRTFSVPKITRTRFWRAKKQKQREHETSEHHLHPESSRLAVCW